MKLDSVLVRLLANEQNTTVPYGYLEACYGRRVVPRHRTMVLDWMAAVAGKYKLCQEALYLAVTLLDRVLYGARSPQTIGTSNLQLVGITCLLVASKLEDVKPLKLSDAVFICAKTFARCEVVDMEVLVGRTLNWRLHASTATAWAFLALFVERDGCGPSAAAGLLAQYITELAIVEYGSLALLPSTLAVTALCMARQHERQTPVLCTTLAQAMDCSLATLRPAALLLCDMLQFRPGGLTGVLGKYSNSIRIRDDAWEGLRAVIRNEWYFSGSFGTVLQALTWGVCDSITLSDMFS